MWNNQEYYFSIIAQTQVYSRSSNSISKVCVMKHSCESLPPVFPSICFFTLVLFSPRPPLLIFCSLSTSPYTFPLYPLFPSSGSFNLPFPQPTTAASQSCQPSLMSGPLNCRPWATRSSIRVRPASIWPEDQSTGPAGPTGAGLGSLLCAQVTTFLPSDRGRASSRLIRRR